MPPVTSKKWPEVKIEKCGQDVRFVILAIRTIADADKVQPWMAAARSGRPQKYRKSGARCPVVRRSGTIATERDSIGSIDFGFVIPAIRDDFQSAPARPRRHNLKVHFVELSLRKYLFLIALTLSCAVWAKPAPNSGDIALKPTPTQAQTA
ncbi:MAG TPA: hypothetical protein VLB69_10935, partial [Rudaea sp.]|nr:hypothetical protein [Rudaea sp.]